MCEVEVQGFVDTDAGNILFHVGKGWAGSQNKETKGVKKSMN